MSTLDSSTDRSKRDAWFGVMACVGLAMVTVLARWPFLTQSFWVDELHSTWVTQESFGDVFPRSQIGNQSPLYFCCLWGWRQIVGDSEWLLRLSSVFAWTAATLAMYLAVVKITRSQTASILAGLFLAVDHSALFYGTELRPYAAVTLVAACLLLQRTREGFAWVGNDLDGSGARWGWGSTLLATIAILLHPTAVVPVVIWWALQWRWDWKWIVTPGVWGMLAWYPVSSTWSHREGWSHFASFPVDQPLAALGKMWNIGGIFVLPSVIVLCLHFGVWQRFTLWAMRWMGQKPSEAWLESRGHIESSRHAPNQKLVIGFAQLLTVALGTMLVMAGLSGWLEIHLWHRRYLVFLFPLMGALIGMALGLATKNSGLATSNLGLATSNLGLATSNLGLATKNSGMDAGDSGLDAKEHAPDPYSHSLRFGFIVVLTMVMASVLQLPQRAFEVAKSSLAWQPRRRHSEDWRAAVEYINRQVPDGSNVYLDPGLIDANRELAADHSEADALLLLQYKTFPLRGAYPLNKYKQLRYLSLGDAKSERFDDPAVFVVRQEKRALLGDAMEDLGFDLKSALKWNDGNRWTVVSFGRPTVLIRQPRR